MKQGLVGQTPRWMEKWVNGQALSVVVSGTRSGRRPEASGGVPQKSVLVDNELDLRQRCALAAKEANDVLAALGGVLPAG